MTIIVIIIMLVKSTIAIIVAAARRIYWELQECSVLEVSRQNLDFLELLCPVEVEVTVALAPQSNGLHPTALENLRRLSIAPDARRRCGRAALVECVSCVRVASEKWPLLPPQELVITGTSPLRRVV